MEVEALSTGRMDPEVTSLWNGAKREGHTVTETVQKAAAWKRPAQAPLSGIYCSDRHQLFIPFLLLAAHAEYEVVTHKSRLYNCAGIIPVNQLPRYYVCQRRNIHGSHGRQYRAVSAVTLHSWYRNVLYAKRAGGSCLGGIAFGRIRGLSTHVPLQALGATSLLKQQTFGA